MERETACRVSLEKAVIEQRSVKLQREALRLARQRAFLREERKRAREEETAISEDKDSLEHVKKADWWCYDLLHFTPVVVAVGDCRRRCHPRDRTCAW